jgi:hypothetical protein
MKTSNLQLNQYSLNSKNEVRVHEINKVNWKISKSADLGFLVFLNLGTSVVLKALSCWLGREEIRIQKAPGVFVTREEEYRHLNSPTSLFRIN